MSKDIFVSASISAFGIGVYGLYYAWKLQRSQAILKKETEVKLSEDEMSCIKLMLDSNAIQKWLDDLYRIISKKFGYDLKNDGQVVQSELFRDYSLLLEYFTFIQEIVDFYKEYNECHDHQKKCIYSANNQDFIRKWLSLFPIVSMDGQITGERGEEGEDNHALDFMLKRVQATLIIKIKYFLNSSEWVGGQDINRLLNVLKEKKCIDNEVDTSRFRNTEWVKVLSVISGA